MTEHSFSPNHHSFFPSLRHYGKTLSEQIEKNQPLRAWLKQKIEEADNLSDEEAQANQEYLDKLKATIDSFRPEGHKVYTLE